ncbi:MarR family winged helix-turn-helix transcriptional regulator [Bacillus sp. EB600]|uniref:MarR family winged helix-turn-helix transcriptional regulator n=1 Tax=Bacillus sp. EB600 TaxID=2806345 RepID=UPI00210DCC3A|nr:winged helix DNA-binding protein [Bacillus sp. EB600]MCQ6278918.1 winged helix DNA-binding protein [Bacillus sp. EB600]
MDRHKLIHTLHQVSRQLTNNLNEVLKQHGLYNAQWAVIYILEKEGSLTQKQLCNYLSVEAPPITRTIQRLVKQDYVRQVQGQDKREKHIQLTEKALNEYPIWEKAVSDLNLSLLEPLSEPTQEELFETLHKWLKKLQ